MAKTKEEMIKEVPKEEKIKEEMIKEVFDLIAEGDARINKETNKGMLLLGTTGAGKSTLTHLLARKPLKTKVDDNTGDTLIEAVNPSEDLKISHRSASETKIPNKQEYKNVTIWDCPGFKDTGGIVQEIANTFYIRRLFETTKNLKIILVMPESALHAKGLRGTSAISIIEQFSKIFKDVKVLENKVTLVITNAPAMKKDVHIKNSLDNIINENSLAQSKENVAQIIKYLQESIQVFHTPTQEGNIPVSDMFDKIESSTQYLEAKVGLVNVIIEQDSVPYAKELLTTSKATLTKLTDIFKSIISKADKNIDENSQNIFNSSFASIQELIPKTLNDSIKIDPKKGSHNMKYFKHLDHLAKLKNTFKDSVESNPEFIKNNLVEILNVFEEFAQPKLKATIQKYIHVFKQQIEFVKFLNDACSESPMDYAPIVTAINASKDVLNGMYEQQVKTITLDPNIKDIGYYEKAIKYLDLYPDDAGCIKTKAKSFYQIGTIHEAKKHSDQALSNYVKALKLDKDLGSAYEKVGDLLIATKDYTNAIKYYKVANHLIKVRDCYDELIKLKPQDSALRAEKADYYLSVGLYAKAHGYYMEAFSLTNDDSAKTAIWQKVSATLTAESGQLTAKAQEYNQKADAHNFYNTDLINIAEMENYHLTISGGASNPH